MNEQKTLYTNNQNKLNLMKRGKMDRKYYALILLICAVLLVSACKRSGAAGGGAPKTPFIGGTSGVTINFEKDSPPPEVTDDESFALNVIVRLKNDGEFAVNRNSIRLWKNREQNLSFKN